MPLALRPAIPPAPDAILVGDPGRALMLAQELLEEPKMSNHARGLWGYTGRAGGGRALTIQSTGMGGPSAAVVLADLAGLGVRRAVRVGTASVVRPGPKLGEVLVVAEALGEGGPSALPGAAAARPDPGLFAALADAGEAATVQSGGLPAALVALLGGEPGRDGDVHDLQTAFLLAAGAELGVAAAALLIVAEDPSGRRLGDAALEESAKSAGRAAAEALSNPEVEG